MVAIVGSNTSGSNLSTSTHNPNDAQNAPGSGGQSAPAPTPAPAPLPDDYVPADPPPYRFQTYNRNGLMWADSSGNDSNLVPLPGQEGDDSLVGTAADEHLEGLGGNDTLRGEAGDDLLQGGAGDDRLVGGLGNDTYVFHRGGGADVIRNNVPHPYEAAYGGTPESDAASTTDVLRFGPGILAADLVISRQNNDLVLRLVDTADQVTIVDFFFENALNSDYGLDRIEFEDAPETTLAKADIYASLLRQGTDAGESLVGFESDDRIDAGAGNDYVAAYAGDDTVDGGDGNDALSGGAGADRLNGGDGADELQGEDGDDELRGGAGNDLLRGGRGNDVYLFGAGGGQDVVRNHQHYDADTDPTSAFYTYDGALESDHFSSTDVLRFTGEITANDLNIARNGAHLVLGIKGTADQVTVEGFFGLGDVNHDFGVDRIEFESGGFLNDDAIREALGIVPKSVIDGTDASETVLGTNHSQAIDARAGNDTVYAGGGNDTVQGGAGSDTLYGQGGADELDGGAADDLLVGGLGSDVYRFGIGDGRDVVRNHRIGYEESYPNSAIYQQSEYLEGDYASATDVLKFKAGITADHLVIRRQGAHLVLSIKDTMDQVTVEGYFARDDIDHRYGVDRIEFEGGGGLSDADIAKAVLAGAGTEYGDNIRGFSTDDTLQGGPGNDTLTGAGGSDTYSFGSGDGQVVVRNNRVSTSYTYDDEQANPKSHLYSSDQFLEPDQAVTTDILKFRGNITAGDLMIRRGGAHLILRIRGTTDEVTVQGFFARDEIDRRFGVDRILLRDDVELTDDMIRAGLLESTEGGDSLRGLNTSDMIAGGGGDDFLEGAGGDDTLEGGAGNDLLSGGAGSDTYLFGVGDGQDVVRNHLITYSETDANAYLYANGIYLESDHASSQDVLKFKEGITADDLVIRRQGAHLVLQIKNTTDQVTVEGFFALDTINRSYGLDSIKFHDDSSLSDSRIGEAILEDVATEGNDTIRGIGFDEDIAADGGDDVVDGAGGDDTLDGGAGNDTLSGGTGNDLYRFGRGDGQDVVRNHRIPYSETNPTAYLYSDGAYLEGDHASARDILKFKDGITRNDLSIRRNGAHLVLAVNDSMDQVTVEGYFARNDIDKSYGVARIEFADGVELEEADIRAAVVEGSDAAETIRGLEGSEEISAGAGDDTVEGAGGDDTLHGGTGNDLLQGGMGSDTYEFGRGDGQDIVRNNRLFGEPAPTNYVYEYGYGLENDHAETTDVLRFKPGIVLSDLSITRDQAHLVLGIKGTTDQVTVEGFFARNDIDRRYGVDKIYLGDGQLLTDENISEAFLRGLGTSGNDTLRGFSSNDMIDAGAGDDVVEGAGGDDTLRGGTGDDTLTGGMGSDTYEFGAGDGQDVVRNNQVSNRFDNQTNPYGYPYTDNAYLEDDHASTTDVLKLTAGIDAGNLTIRRDGAHLILGIRGMTDQVTVEGYFARNDINKSYGVDRIEFADGVELEESVIRAALVEGGDAAQSILGLEASEAISAGAGDDTVDGAGGDDTLSGDAGNDVLRGGTGSDTYEFGRGDGQDVVRNSQLWNQANPRSYLYDSGIGLRPASSTAWCGANSSSRTRRVPRRAWTSPWS